MCFLACVGDTAVTGDAGPDASTNDASTNDAIADVGQQQETSTDAATEQAPWTPAQLTGLALWLNADTATADVSSKVSTWLDQSPNHNDAKQTTEANAPYFASTNINGHKAVHFDKATPTSLTIADSASLQWNQSFVVEIVVRHPQATGAEIGAIYVKQQTSGAYAGPSININATTNPYNAYASFQITSNDFIGALAQTPVDANPHRIHASWDGTNAALRIGTAAPITAAYTGVSGVGANGQPATVGCATGGGFCYNGDVAEIVAVAGATINANDIALLEAYLDAKYKL